MEDKKVAVIEAYRCVQGEGRYIGVPSLLIRMTGCKLRCQFAGSFCDTYYASWNPNKGSLTLEDIEKVYKDNVQITHTIISGGGPTLNGPLLQQLCDIAKAHGHHITIETEGSEFVATVADCISLSPKLSNSTPILGSIKPWNNSQVTQQEIDRHELWRKNYKAMKQLIAHHPEYYIKPVISKEEDLVEVKQIMKELDVDPKNVYLMPEGLNDEQLQSKRQWLLELCIEEGFNYTDRLHVIVYGDKRGV